MAKIISDLEIVGRMGPLICYMQNGKNLIKKTSTPFSPTIKKDQAGQNQICLKAIQCLSEQWMQALRKLTCIAWPRGLTSTFSALMWYWLGIESCHRQVHLRLIEGMRLAAGKEALEGFSWSSYPKADAVLRRATFLNQKTWDIWLDQNILEHEMAKADLPRPTHLRVIYAEPNPEDGSVLMYGFARQPLKFNHKKEPVYLTPEKFSLTGNYLLAFLEYCFEKPEQKKIRTKKKGVPGGIVLIGYHLP